MYNSIKLSLINEAKGMLKSVVESKIYTPPTKEDILRVIATIETLEDEIRKDERG